MPFPPVVPVWAAEPAGERPADGCGTHQTVQQHPGNSPAPHLTVEPCHAARSEEGQGGPGPARPNSPP